MNTLSVNASLHHTVNDPLQMIIDSSVDASFSTVVIVLEATAGDPDEAARWNAIVIEIHKGGASRVSMALLRCWKQRPDLYLSLSNLPELGLRMKAAPSLRLNKWIHFRISLPIASDEDLGSRAKVSFNICQLSDLDPLDRFLQEEQCEIVEHPQAIRYLAVEPYPTRVFEAPTHRNGPWRQVHILIPKVAHIDLEREIEAEVGDGELWGDLYTVSGGEHNIGADQGSGTTKAPHQPLGASSGHQHRPYIRKISRFAGDAIDDVLGLSGELSLCPTSGEEKEGE